MNKASGPIAALKSEIDKTGLGLAGVVDYDEALVEWNISGKSIFDFKSKSTIVSVNDIVDKLIGEENADRAIKRKVQ